MNFKHTLFTTLLAALVLAGCARVNFWKGNEHYHDLNYVKAIRYYEKALDKKAFAQAKINLADCYRLNNQYQKAEHWYRQVMVLPERKDIHVEYYVKVLINNGKPSLAQRTMEQYLEENPEQIDEDWKHLQASCDSAAWFTSDSMFYSVEKLGPEINSDGTDFSMIFFGSQKLIFVSDRREKGTSKWTGDPYLDLYLTRRTPSGKFLEPVPLEGKINGLYHEGPAVYDNKRRQIIFTRNNYIGTKRGKDDEKVNHLKLYTADYESGKWQNITELSLNSEKYSVGHPALTADGDTLYFASDMPGGYGGTDLYLSTRIGERWSQPMNLGRNINTHENELFPFVDADGVMYFASNGHAGLGGLDIYKTKHSGGNWAVPYNLKYPVNSARDDFAYIYDKETDAGYFSSNRDKTDGTDEIFRYERHYPEYHMHGTVTNSKTKEPVPGVKVALRDVATGAQVIAMTDQKGYYGFPLEKGKEYKFDYTKSHFYRKDSSLSTKGQRWSKEYELNIEMKPIIIGEVFVLNNIYYDYDKSDLRPESEKELDRLVKILEDNPTITVELSSHTDARGTAQYNDKLSQKRAESAVRYIIVSGIPRRRIIAKGYGEHQLVNHCKDGVECTEDEHQMNRRTEFKILKDEEETL